MVRFNLPELNFFEKEPETILQEMLLHINEKTGLSFERADPRRKIVEGLTTFISIERNKAEHALKQTLLAYAEDDALDHKGADSDTPRLKASAASTTMQFNLESDRVSALVIPAGTRFLIGNTYFATEETKVVPVGQNIALVDAVCMETGTIANGYLPGEISTLVDPLPYVISVQNTTETAGGADVEDDDSYAERIHLAPERYSVAGPEEAYKYWALTASQEIIDAEVTSPLEGTVHITILLKDGRSPTEEHIERVLEICSATDKRPLTDKVTASGPEVVEYSPTIQYWIPNSKATVATSVQKEVELAFQDFLIWQRSKLGRDINDVELISRLREKGAYKIITEGMGYTELSATQVANELNPTISFMGLIDE